MALLDISYLWVDLLCIVQDSKADWTKEAYLMSRVYGEAYLNVTATASKSDEEGIFDREKSLHSRPTCLLDLSGPEISSKRYICYNATPWQQYVQASPWKERAWTFQEALLAPRTIHFARGLLLWECAEERTAENMPGQISDSKFASREGNDRLLKQALLDDSQELREDTDRRIINSVEVSSEHLWEDIVFQYTHGTLSYPSDKLLAIAGVARKFCSARHLNPCTYLAGLWKEMLPANLLWRGEAHLRLFGGLHGRQRTQMYRAPSWSWAGVNDGPITYPIRRKWEMWPIDVLDAYVISDDEQMGAVRGGSIKLKGKLLKAHDFEEFTSWIEDSDEGGECYGAFIVPRVHSDSSETEPRVAYLKSSLDDTRNPDSTIWRTHIRDPPDDLKVWEDHFFLPVLRTRVRGASDPELVGEVIMGLDLMPSGREGEFSRIGTFEILASSSPAFVNALGCRSVPAENYEDFDGVDRLPAPARETYIRRMLLGVPTAPITFRETQIRTFIAIYWIWIAHLILDTYNILRSVCFIRILQVDNPDEWHPLFGSPLQAYSIRRLWTKFWHRLTAPSCVASGRLITRGALGCSLAPERRSCSLPSERSSFRASATPWLIGKRKSIVPRQRTLAFSAQNFASGAAEMVVLAQVERVREKHGHVQVARFFDIEISNLPNEHNPSRTVTQAIRIPTPAQIPTTPRKHGRNESTAEWHRPATVNTEENMVYANMNVPWSAFLCDSQGGGKSHTLIGFVRRSDAV
ncbi:hypothetical protein EPUS_03331 [Endocarpon pusillum Z07020]|uniref:Heterokaryon incompatibility domain-containing protein n=1 Tax=Endocarpon pusillum (strain Z07020 / HMAS-L-300199) TaxID=1263415 RepID=U1GGY8_ENDPU|nr:uncharacterized protein EPUS_03331 [Endocarpon pusillum Z07020]ERF71051.1 hypothetical protein EPUS_03331 [Endocarpon pusillum Z07020]